MSWGVHVEKNDVKVTLKIAKDLLKCGAEVCATAWDGFTPADICQQGRLEFNPDDGEHMDYLSQSEIQAVLLKHRVKGDICFRDDFGALWGYRFDGEGGVATLKGDVTWTVEEIIPAVKYKPDL